jgi:hypothetical protein
MLSKCANPSCSTTLHYLRSGKVFKFETQGPTLVNERKPVRKVEHFWLCGSCSETRTVTYDHALGVRVLEKPIMIRRAAAS